MNHMEVDIVRDVAKKLISTEPRAALELFSLCLESRPDGQYLKAKCVELKEQLGITSFVVLGNCQATPISELIKFKNQNFQVVSVLKWFEMLNNNTIPAALFQADYIITQPLSNKYGVLATDKLQEKFSQKIVVIPSCFFKGFHPEWNYFKYIEPSNSRTERVQSPVGDYHNKTVYDAFVEGLDVEATVDRLHDPKFNRERYGGLAEESINELRRRENSTDVIISDYIWSNFAAGQSLFHSYNHPNKTLLNELVNRVLTHLGLDFNQQSTPGECLDKVNLGQSILTGQKTSIINRGDIYEDRQFVKDSFEIYRKLQSQAV